MYSFASLRIANILNCFLDNPSPNDFHCLFIHYILVWSDCAGHNRLAKPPVAFNDDLIWGSGNGIYGEHHAGNFGVNHFLYAYADENIFVFEAFLDSVEDSSGCEQA